MAVEPCPHFGVLVGGIIVEDDMDGLVAWHAGIDRVQKTDELLMPVPLHVPPDHGSVEDIECSEQRGRAIALVIMGGVA